MPKYTINIDERVFNPVYMPYLQNPARYEVFYGGAGSGKSRFVAQKKVYQHLAEPGHKTLIVRKVAKTLHDSCFAEICGIINEWGVSQLFQVNKSTLTISGPHGDQFLFVGLDDVEKLKSIANITDMWIEEASEIEQSDFQQLDLRLRGKAKVNHQITLTFNPVSALHWLKTEFFDRTHDNASVLKTTYKDNHFLDAHYEKVLQELREKDPYYYQVYCLNLYRGSINSPNSVDTLTHTSNMARAIPS